jgi:hypothetical protein
MTGGKKRQPSAMRKRLAYLEGFRAAFEDGALPAPAGVAAALRPDWLRGFDEGDNVRLERDEELLFDPAFRKTMAEQIADEMEQES